MAAAKRIEALDVFRGITVAAMILFNNPGSWSMVYTPLHHATWNGLTPTDLAFPFFMTIMGISIFLSMRKYNGSLKSAFPKIIKRAILLFFIGIVLGSLGSLCKGTFSFENVRILGVLQRLAIAYFFGAFLCLVLPKKAWLPVSGGILLLYLLVLQILDGYAYDASNLCARVDVAVLGASHMITESGFAFEPEGILSTFPCIAHVLLGVYAGSLLCSEDKVKTLAILGTVCLFIGFLLSWLDPINKKLWTSSYVLVTSGSAFLSLALLITIIDEHHCSGNWTAMFKVFGTNAIYAYSLSFALAVVFDVFAIKGCLYSNVILPIFSWGGPKLPSLVYGLLFICLIWLLTFPLYKKGIVVKI